MMQMIPTPTDAEREFAKFVLQVAVAFDSIEKVLEKAALVAPDRLVSEIEGEKRMAGHLKAEAFFLIREAGGGVDVDGDPDPFAQEGR